MAMDDALVTAVTEYGLIHDAEEWYTGDIPSPFKRDLREKCPAVSEHLDNNHEISTLVKGVIKLADCLEAIHFLREYGGSRAATQEIYSDLLLNFDRNLAKYRSVLPDEIIASAIVLRDDI